jgi:hypothetical protein
MELPPIRIADLVIGLLAVVNGAVLLHHFRKHGERFAKWRVACFFMMLCGFLVAFGEFFYDLAFLR